MAGNTEIPQYAKTAPESNPNCQGRGFGDGINIVNPPNGSGGKDAEVLPGFSIGVTDLSDVGTDRFKVDWNPYEEITVSLSIISKESTIVKSNPILKGTVIDEINTSWVYNPARDADITVQTIVNTGGTDPTLTFADRDYDYTGLSVTEDQTVTIDGTDGISSSDDVSSVTFGNYIAIGVTDPSLLTGILPSALQGIYDGLASRTIETTQAGHSFDAFGTSTEYMLIFHPENMGESEFTKGSFTGGYKRIYSVTRSGNPLLVDEVLGGDTVNDIIIDNGKNGFSENHFVYMSEYPGRTADKPTIMSKK